MARKGWSKSLSGFAREVEAQQNKRLRATALQALSGVIERSPVDTGAFRGSHRVSVATPDNGYSLEDTDRSGSATLAKGSAKIQSVRTAWEVIYVQSNLPYAEAIEFGQFIYKPAGKTTPAGYSIQAPAGVYAITFDNLRAQNT
ncbi:hypothetical protein [Halomonas sp. DN3]|uniref:hypothetical protein n=1 Tax=Halomonas sp. DN3 TaxID=2953657 RepID=UPI00209DC912|nr:hypothetical protein [Halomonas sp. DN3]USZ48133.1 hypothetical protein NKF27_11390 [Halomonas sp. DN3]